MTFTDGERGAQGSCKAREGQKGIKPAEWRLPYTDCPAVHPPQPYPFSQPLTAKCSRENPHPNPGPDQRMPGAWGRSAAWSKEPMLPGPRNHPSLCRARSRHLAPAPSSRVAQVPGQDGPGLLSHTHIRSVEGPWGLWSLLTPSIISACYCNGSPGLPACPCSPHSGPGTAVGVSLIRYIRSSHSFALSLLVRRPKASLPVASAALPSPLAASAPHTPSSYAQKPSALLHKSPTRHPSLVPGRCLGGL